MGQAKTSEQLPAIVNVLIQTCPVQKSRFTARAQRWSITFPVSISFERQRFEHHRPELSDNLDFRAIACRARFPISRSCGIPDR